MTKSTETGERELGKTLGGSANASAPRIVPKSEQENAGLWLTENGTALESSNEFVAAHGLPLARHRQFYSRTLALRAEAPRVEPTWQQSAPPRALKGCAKMFEDKSASNVVRARAEAFGGAPRSHRREW